MSKSLHTLNTPPSDLNTLSQCLKALSETDELLLIEDAVYLALPIHRSKLPTNIITHALKIDIEARGIKADESVVLINDAEFVNLTLRCDRVVSWF
ncbi:MAG: sulfurtransferase complex subunit TusB [Oceanospirillales bacterium]|nr:MAG: sulfurtransferase complex subunit TusB [Oceanospirillales bacterium]